LVPVASAVIRSLLFQKLMANLFDALEQKPLQKQMAASTMARGHSSGSRR
jgi:hypothetical protein